MSETNTNTSTTTTSNKTVIDTGLGSAENVEKLVEFTKKISEQEMTIQSLQTDISSQKAEIEKYKTDIARLQKVIADNFIISTDKPKETMQVNKSFNDAYKEFIIENEKNNEKK